MEANMEVGYGSDYMSLVTPIIKKHKRRRTKNIFSVHDDSFEIRFGELVDVLLF